jgi:hypothetical protein
MEEKEFKWKMPSLAKKVDVNDAIIEFEKIKKDAGKLTPEVVVEFARDENSTLHKLFTWDDSKAAEQYRLQQARNIINNVEVVTIRNGEQIEIPNYEIITTEAGREYKSIDILTFDEIAQVRDNAKAALVYWSNKLKLYKEFKKVVEHLEKAVETFAD